MPPVWLIRPALLSDIPAIIPIERACPEAPHWSDASWLAALANEQPPKRLGFVAEDPAGLLGFAVILRAGNLAELETIAVAPSSRRQGIGNALLQAAMDAARDHGATSIELEVRASSDGPRRLYQSLGFVQQGTRLRYYQNPTEDAILMAAALQPKALVDLPEVAIRKIAGDPKV